MDLFLLLHCLLLLAIFIGYLIFNWFLFLLINFFLAFILRLLGFYFHLFLLASQRFLNLIFS